MATAREQIKICKGLMFLSSASWTYGARLASITIGPLRLNLMATEDATIREQINRLFNVIYPNDGYDKADMELERYYRSLDIKYPGPELFGPDLERIMRLTRMMDRAPRSKGLMKWFAKEIRYAMTGRRL